MTLQRRAVDEVQTLDQVLVMHMTVEQLETGEAHIQVAMFDNSGTLLCVGTHPDQLGDWMRDQVRKLGKQAVANWRRRDELYQADARRKEMP